jgi:hypothetical protein
MAKRRQTKEDMEIQQLKEHLSKQDKTLAEQSLKQEGVMVTLKEILFILGGSASLDVKGLRSDVKDLKKDVLDLKEYVEKSENTKGQFIIRLNNIPSKVVAFFVFIGTLLSIALAVKELFVK